MTTVLTFVIPGEPASKARARFTNYGSKVRAYTPGKTLTAEAAVRAAYLAIAQPGTDPERAYGVVVEFLHQTGQRRDIDNMLKLILDGLNKVAWPDDVQVTRIEATKRRVPKGDAETRVTIHDLGQIEKPRGKCIRCGTGFPQYASTSARKFCTRECGYAYRKENRTRECLNCGTEFLSRHGARFCGVPCNSEHKRVDLICAYCTQPYTLPRSLANKGKPACSMDCRRAMARENRKARAVGTCQDCAGPTSRKTAKRCRSCHYAAGGRWADKHIIRTVIIEEIS